VKTFNDLQHAIDHDLYSDIGVDDHHDRPSAFHVSNTTLNVPPLPGGPAVWDISVPTNAKVVQFLFQGPKVVAPQSGKAGAGAIAYDAGYRATGQGIGAWTSMATTNYTSIWSLMVSSFIGYKVFTASGEYVGLSNAYLLTSGGRWLRTEWTNIGASNYTLTAKGIVAVLG